MPQWNVPVATSLPGTLADLASQQAAQHLELGQFLNDTGLGRSIGNYQIHEQADRLVDLPDGPERLRALSDIQYWAGRVGGDLGARTQTYSRGSRTLRSEGGTEYLRTLRGPFSDVSFVATVGIRVGEIDDWLSAGAVAVGVGHDLTRPEGLPEEMSGTMVGAV